MKNIYTSVDMGSDTIKVVVCELHKNRLNLLAYLLLDREELKRGYNWCN